MHPIRIFRDSWGILLGLERCQKTVMYAGDDTIWLTGNLDTATEDFAMVISKRFYTNNTMIRLRT